MEIKEQETKIAIPPGILENKFSMQHNSSVLKFWAGIKCKQKYREVKCPFQHRHLRMFPMSENYKESET